ncbi:hypothetical protein IQ264_31260 [Phormidium sp. LEGE 05292]|uniref:hypothetical protein n=1 Tax=[Phormidium] sp. LEGE 05292 TaxID=767427 RepID=UPI0018818BF7|nr:hypothetical protein [Phormidium sp. LEGE 05292]MBE9229884.1 hypothetical protein [Phormidium sp. LEGE 05292]
MSQDQPKQPEVSTQDTIPSAASLPPETAMPVPSPLTDTLPAEELTVPSPLRDTLPAEELTVPSPLTDTLSAAELTVPSPLTDTLPAATTVVPHLMAETLPAQEIIVPTPEGETLAAATIPAPVSEGETLAAATTPAPVSKAETPAKAAPVAKKPSFLSKIWGLWKAFLTKVRQILPESVRQKLPNDTVLTGAIALILILILWVNSLLSPGKPAQVAEVPPTIPSTPSEVTTPPEATIPPEVTIPPETTIPPEVTTPLEDIPVSEIPVPSEITTPSETPVFTPVPEEEKVASGIEAPLELTEPEPPKPIETLPPPPPVLTPEQTLIAAIQNQVADIASEFANGLIVGIKADFPNNFLSLQVANDWYTFDSAKQDQLAADMWQRSQKLDFEKLEIYDTQGRLVARSPVIGSNMIIWQRKLTGLS